MVTSELTRAEIAGFDRARIPLVVIDPVNLPTVEVASTGATNWAAGQASSAGDPPDWHHGGSACSTPHRVTVADGTDGS